MTTIQITRLKCLRCGKTWTPRGDTIKCCPKCKSTYWQEPWKDHRRKE